MASAIVEGAWTTADSGIVIATLLGPILAVQAQKWLERGRAIADRRLAIFRTLMATRATLLSPLHVEALNAVPVEFYGRDRKLKAIVDDWHAYLDLLGETNLEGQVLLVKRQDALLDMLHKMSTHLGFKFSRSEIQKDVYYPTGHHNIEQDQDEIRRGFAKLFKGEIAIPMAVKEFPVDDDAILEQEEVRKLLLEWLKGGRALRVNTK